jgi:hypothetical protein
MSDFNSEEYFTREEAAARLGVSGNSLWLKTSRGDFHPMRLGRRIFYLRDEIEDAARLAEDIRGKVLIGRLAAPAGGQGKSATEHKLEKGLQGVLDKQTSGSKNFALRDGLPYTGDEAARSFRMWDEGKNKRQAVEDLKLRCDIVEYLYDKWQKFGDELHIPPKMVEIMRARFKWTESPPSAKGFWAALVAYVDQEVRRSSKDYPPAGRTPAGRTPVGSTPVGSTPVGCTPVGSTPQKRAYEPITDEERRLLEEEENAIPPKSPNTDNASNQPIITPTVPEPDDGSLPFC